MTLIGAAFMIPSQNGRTALYHAAMRSYFETDEVTRALLVAGVDKNAVDKVRGSFEVIAHGDVW